jgi:uncharacterized protein Yka (UPF0111/DUF47 family)
MKLLLAPLVKLAELQKQSADNIAEIKSYLTVDVKKASEQTYEELKNHTALLTDIKELLKEAVKNNGGNTGEAPKVKLPGIISGIGAGLAIITMAAALVAAAGILGIMPNVTPSQLLTAIAVGGVMVLLAPVFGEILHTLSGGSTLRMLVSGGAMTGGFANPMAMLKSAGVAVAAMVGMAAAITLSSALLSLIVVPSLAQLGTAVLIGIALLPASYAFGAVVRSLQSGIGLNKKGMADIGMTALALVAIAGSIVAVAYVFQLLPTNQAAPDLGFTLRAGAAIALFAFGYSKILEHIKGKSLKDVIFASLAIPAIALAIVGVANVFRLMPDTNTAPTLGFTIKAAAAIGLFAFGFTKILKTIQGKSIKDIMFAALAIPFIAIAIVGVAYIFSMLPEAPPAPDLLWTLGSAAAVLLFGFGFVMVTTMFAKAGIGIKDIFIGVLASAAVALAIVGVAWIFSVLPGTFNAPPLEWSLKAGLAILIFALPMMALSAFILATGGTGALALLGGAVGMILVAGVIWVVAWIFSKLPTVDVGAIDALSRGLMSPLHAMIDVLKRFKDDIGIENMLGLAGGMVAVAGGWLTLVAAIAGQAAGGFVSSIANLGSSIVDGISGLFGGKKTLTPIDILDKLLARAGRIELLATPIEKVGTAFKRIATFQDDVIDALGAMNSFLGGAVYYNMSGGNILDNVGKNMKTIASASKGINISAIKASTEMFDSLRALAEADGEDAITAIAKKLMKAVKELSSTVDNLESAVEKMGKGQEKSGNFLTDSIKAMKDSVTSAQKEVAAATSNLSKESSKINLQPVVSALNSIEDRLDQPITVTEDMLGK